MKGLTNTAKQLLKSTTSSKKPGKKEQRTQNQGIPSGSSYSEEESLLRKRAQPVAHELVDVTGGSDQSGSDEDTELLDESRMTQSSSSRRRLFDNQEEIEMEDFSEGSKRKAKAAPAQIPDAMAPTKSNILNALHDGALISTVFGFFTTSQGKEWMTNTGAHFLFPPFVVSAVFQGIDEWDKYGKLVEEINLNHLKEILETDLEKLIAKEQPKLSREQATKIRRQHVAIQAWKNYIGVDDKLFEDATNPEYQTVPSESDSDESNEGSADGRSDTGAERLNTEGGVRSVKDYSKALLDRYKNELNGGLLSTDPLELDYDPNSPAAIDMRKRVNSKFFWDKYWNKKDIRASYNKLSDNLYTDIYAIAEELYNDFDPKNELKDKKRTNFRFYAFCEVIRKYDEIQKQNLIDEMNKEKKDHKENWETIQEQVSLAIRNNNPGIYGNAKDKTKLINDIYGKLGITDVKIDVVKNIIAREIANKLMDKQEKDVDNVVSKLITFDEKVLLAKQQAKAMIATAGALLTSFVVGASTAVAAGAIGAVAIKGALIAPIVFTAVGLLKATFHLGMHLYYAGRTIQTNLQINSELKNRVLTAKEEYKLKERLFVGQDENQEVVRKLHSYKRGTLGYKKYKEEVFKKLVKNVNLSTATEYVNGYKKATSPTYKALEKKRDGFVKERNEHATQASIAFPFTAAVAGVMLINKATFGIAGAVVGTLVGIGVFCLGMMGFAHKVKEKFELKPEPKATADNFVVPAATAPRPSRA